MSDLAPLAPPTQPPLAALRGLVNGAGGLAYHLTALRFRRTLWQPYHAQVADVLALWAPPQRALVVIGPSAGWNLPAAFLARFDTVTAIEPDPLARWLLRRRFAKVHWQFDANDYFTPHGPLPWRDNLDRLFARYPHQALLFSEFLGQLLGLYPDAVATERDGALVTTPAFDAWRGHLRAHLQARTFCTLHDRWVSHTPPLPLPAPPLPFAVDGPPPPALWPQPDAALDPLTATLTPQPPQRVLLWQRLPGRWHVMAAAWR